MSIIGEMLPKRRYELKFILLRHIPILQAAVLPTRVRSMITATRGQRKMRKSAAAAAARSRRRRKPQRSSRKMRRPTRLTRLTKGTTTEEGV